MDKGASSYRRFLAGDDAGVVELVRDYKNGLILFLDRYVGNLSVAEELAEDTFVRLVTRRPRFVERASFKTFLYTIGRNVALTYLKGQRRMSPVPVEELGDLASEEESLERAYLREERKIALHRALSQISPDYGAVLYLKFFEDMTNEEIARVMKKSKRQVENLLYQAKRALRTKLEQEGFSHEGL